MDRLVLENIPHNVLLNLTKLAKFRMGGKHISNMLSERSGNLNQGFLQKNFFQWLSL